MTQPESALLSVTYVSTSAAPLTQTALEAILRQSRDNNERSGLTGMLAVRGDDFFQVVEGPPPAVRHVLQRLREDTRHSELRVLVEEEIDYRRFPDWTMRCENLDDYPADSIPGYRASHEDESDARRHRILDLVRWFQHRATRALAERGRSATSPS